MNFLYDLLHRGEVKLHEVREKAQLLDFDPKVLETITTATQKTPEVLKNSKSEYGFKFSLDREVAEGIMSEHAHSLKENGYFLFHLNFFHDLGLIKSRDQFDILRKTEWWGFMDSDNKTTSSEDQINSLIELGIKYPFEIIGGAAESLELYFPHIPSSFLEQQRLINAFDELMAGAQGSTLSVSDQSTAFKKYQTLVYRS